MIPRWLMYIAVSKKPLDIKKLSFQIWSNLLRNWRPKRSSFISKLFFRRLGAYKGLYHKQNGQLSYSHQSQNFLADRNFQGLDLNWGQGVPTCISIKIKHSPFFFQSYHHTEPKNTVQIFPIILSFWKIPSVTPANWYNSSVLLRTLNEFVLLIICVLTSSRTLGLESLKIFGHLPNTY